MSTFEGATDGGDRDRKDEEGFYTEVNDEGAEVRTVHGQYTETEEGAPDPLVEGEYTESEANEEVVESVAEQGDYTDRDQ
jgi:hypothetical protein